MTRCSLRSEDTEEAVPLDEGGGNGVAAAGCLLPARYALASTPLATSSFQDAMGTIVVGVPHFVLVAGSRRTSTAMASLCGARVGVAVLITSLLPEATPTMQRKVGLLTFLIHVIARTSTRRGEMKGKRMSLGKDGRMRMSVMGCRGNRWILGMAVDGGSS